MKNARSLFAVVCLGLWLFALAAFPLTSFAQHVAGAPFVPLPLEYFETAGRMKVTTPIADMQVAGGKRLFDSSSITTDGGAGVKASGSGIARNPSGNSYPVDASRRIPNTGVAGAVGRAIPKIIKQVAGPLGVGVILYDLAKELDFELAKDSAGTGLGVSKLDSTVCTVSPCYGYTIFAGPRTSEVVSTLSEACTVSIAATGYEFLGLAPPDGCYYNRGFGQERAGVSVASVPPSQPTYVPSTQQAFLDAIAAKSGWPSSSKIGALLRDSLQLVPSPAIETGPISVTGPASSPGVVTTTNNTTNNTTNTETTTHNHSYAGDTVTTTTTITNITIDNSTGAVTNNTTTTKTAEPTPSDQCKDNPDSSGCAKLGTAPDSDKLTKKPDHAVTVVSTAFAGGSCPPGITFSAIGRSYTFGYGPMCDVLAILKFVFLAMAGVMAAYILADSFKV